MIKTSWTEAWKVMSFRLQLIITLIVLISIALFISRFFIFIQHRQGFSINDVVLNWITPYNVSIYIFLIIYSLVILSIVKIGPNPISFLKAIQAYALLLGLRIITLYSFSLEAHHAIIPLEDPFIGYFFYDENVITKDLFFSGHVSTVFLLCLVNPSPSLNNLYRIGLILVSILILVQHAHYTVDVIFAPLFAWLSYKVVQYIPVKV